MYLMLHIFIKFSTFGQTIRNLILTKTKMQYVFSKYGYYTSKHKSGAAPVILIRGLL
jgi:hypothetical protein